MDPKKRLRNQCDKLWYRALLKDKCEICGGPAIQVHHFYYKSSYSHLRYDLDNGISLCRGCHFVLHHQDPKKIEEQIIARRGKNWLNKLQKKSRQRPKQGYLTMDYYRKTKVALEDKLKQL